MGFLERARLKAQEALGEPVEAIAVVLPAGIFKQLAQDALIQGIASASPVPIVGDKIADAVEQAADKRRDQQLRAVHKRTVTSTSTVWNYKSLLLVLTGTRLAIFDAKQGLLRNSLNQLRWARSIATTAGLDVSDPRGLFGQFAIQIPGETPLTFRYMRKFLPTLRQMQAAVQARQPAVSNRVGAQ